MPPNTPDPNKDPDTCNGEGNPCNAGTGNKYQHELDYLGIGSFPLRGERIYNSRNVESDHWGSNWRGSYSRSVEFVTNGTISTANIKRFDGKQYTFNLLGSSWVTDGDLAGKLLRLTDVNANPIGWEYVNENDEIEIFDMSGKLVSITNRAGLVQTMVYSCKKLSATCPVVTPDSIAPTDGLLLTVIDPSGRQLNFTYDSAARVATMVDPTGGIYRYTYVDATTNANLSSVNYPDGKVRSYLYGESAYVSATPIAGVSYAHALTGLVDENGTRFATWKYDDNGRAISSEHAVGIEKVTLAYNADRTTTVADSRGNVRNLNFGIVNGVVKNTARTLPAGSGSLASSSATTYDINGNVSSYTDYSGSTTTYVYDLARNLETSRTEAVGSPQARTITTAWHPTFRLPVLVTEPGRSTATTYDTEGRKLSETVTETNTNQTRTSAWTYNSRGLLASFVDPLNNTTSFTYYADTAFTGQGASATGHTIDDLQSITNAVGHVISFNSYDKSGRVLNSTDAKGVVTELSYTPRGRVASVTVTPPGGTARITRYTYDAVGQLIDVVNPDLTHLLYEYDAAHRLIRARDAKGNSVTYILDNAGNRIAQEVRDPTGNLLRAISRTFDALNRLQQVTGAPQ